MTPHDKTPEGHREAFGRMLAFVAAMFPSANLDAATITAYYRVLAAVPLPVLQRVAQAIVEHEPPYEHFPAAPVWLALANDLAEQEHSKCSERRRQALQGPPHCAVCRDTGWEVQTRDDGRQYVVRCACRDSNPVYQASIGPRRYHVPTRADRRTLAAGKEDA